MKFIRNADSTADEILDEAAQIQLVAIDEARPIIAPAMRLHCESKYAHLAIEQLALFEGEGKDAARESLSLAAETKRDAEDQDVRVAAETELLNRQLVQYERAKDVLGEYAMRTSKEKKRYWMTMFALLFGDVAGISGAAIALGEIVWLAAAQAVAVAVAMVAVGTLGAEVKHARAARKRQKTDLTEDEKHYAGFFSGTDSGEFIVKCVVIGGLATVVLVFGGILALRSVTDGALGGITFGFLATAIALGSWGNSFTFADEAADRLESQTESWLAQEKRHEAVSTGGPRAVHARSEAEAQSIKEEYEARGVAAYERVLAAPWIVRENNPAIAGHGVALTESESPSATGHETTSSFFGDKSRTIHIEPLVVPATNGNGKEANEVGA